MTPEVQLAAAFEPGKRAAIEPFVPHIASRRLDSLYGALVDHLIAGIERAISGGSSAGRR